MTQQDTAADKANFLSISLAKKSRSTSDDEASTAGLEFSCRVHQPQAHPVDTMANRQPLKTTFEPEKVIRPIYTGGSVALSNGAQILATTLEGDAILTDPSNGRHLAKIEGVR